MYLGVRKSHQKCHSPAVCWICLGFGFCLTAMLGMCSIGLLDARNVCVLTHQSELVQSLLGSTSQLGDIPGLQSTQAWMPRRNSYWIWRWHGHLGRGAFWFIWLYHWCHSSAKLGMWMSCLLRFHVYHCLLLCNSTVAKMKMTFSLSYKSF